MLLASVTDLGQQPHWSALPQIVFINLLLSGDNAVVIAMACRALPRRQRIWGLAIGEAAAVLLLIVFAAVLVRVLQWPYLKIAGGLALIYIAARLLLPDEDGNEVEAAASLWRAIGIVVTADIVMSFDNVLAVVQVANGNLMLLAIGLSVSIPVIIAGAAIITTLLDRLPFLAWIGAGLLGWVAGQTIAEDRAFVGFTRGVADVTRSGDLERAAGCAGVALVIAIGFAWRGARRRGARRDTARRD